MADESKSNNTLLYAALIAAGAYLLLKPKNEASASTAAASGWADASTAGGAAAATYPTDIVTIATQNGVDPATALAVIKYDAQYYNHPDTLSTPYFVNSPATFAAALALYRAQGGSAGSGSAASYDSDVVTIATQNGVDPATALAVIKYDAQYYNHPDTLSTPYFVNSPATFAAALALYRAQGGSTSGGSAAAVAPATAPTAAPVSNDGAPHRGTADDVKLDWYSPTDLNSLKTIVQAFPHITVEDAVDVVSFQEKQDSKTWSQVAADYAANPTWFSDKAVEYNATNPRYRVNFS